MSLSLLEKAVRKQGADTLIASLTEQQRNHLLSTWSIFARPEQLEPDGDWLVWLILSGRGWGKSRVGAETVRKWAIQYPKCHIALIGRTAADVRDVMVRTIQTPWRGGILDPETIPIHVPSTRSMHWRNGSFATTYSADEPRQLLGKNFDLAWCDELASWPASLSQRKETGERSVMEEVWNEGLMLSLRGNGADRPRVVVTTTPRPKRLLFNIIKDPKTVITRGSTYDNRKNLSPEFIPNVERLYEGSRIGRQELHGEVLDEVLGALWSYSSIDDHRVQNAPDDLTRIVVGVDPSGKSDDGDEQGIVVCARDGGGNGYVLADRTTRDTPEGWGRRAVKAYEEFRADVLVAEKNYGGEMVEATIKTAAANMGVRVNYKGVDATRGKVVRAEPISALYEQGKIHHVGPAEQFLKLEEQMREYTPDDGRSPDRMDAMVWAMTELFGNASRSRLLLNADFA